VVWPTSIRWRLERDRGLVVGRSATDVDDDPAVGERHVGRFTRADEPAAEDICVEPNRALYVLRNDEMREGDFVWRGAVLGPPYSRDVPLFWR